MNLGLELVTCALRTGTVKPFIEAGIGHEYVNDQGDPSRLAVFPDQHMQAWRTILSYQDKHGKAPSVDIFQRSYPADAYELSEEDYEPAELIGIFQEDRRRMLAQTAAGELAEFVAQGDIAGALNLMEQAAKLIRETHQASSIVVTWDDKDYDLEGRIHRQIKRGLLTGIEGFDKQEEFLGFQPGNLICYLGRAKAGKTSFALLSALRAWEDGKRVLFLSFEIAAGRIPSEPGVTDRLDSIGARVNMLDYMQGRLSAEHERKLREFRDAWCSDGLFKVVQPTGRYTVDDLERDVEKYEPDIVYVDGFYFMTDALTGKPGSNWEGHDNLANDIKKLAMNRLIPIVITHQVREKQLHGKKGAGIDDGAMMGGTAIIMFADLVIGVDADDEGKRTLSCTRSRLHYLQTVFGNWDWNTCTFNECAPEENPFDQEVFGYQTGGSDDKPPWDQ